MNVYMMFSVLLDLMLHDKITAKSLAEKLEISTRTIYRYVDSLSASGVPISTSMGRNGGIFLTQKYDLGSVFFTAPELNLMTELLKNSADQIAKFVIQKLEVINKHQHEKSDTTQTRNTLSK